MKPEIKNNSVKLATGFATLVSLVALSACFILSSMIYSEVQSVWNELDDEIMQFKVIFLNCFRESAYNNASVSK